MIDPAPSSSQPSLAVRSHCPVVSLKENSGTSIFPVPLRRSPSVLQESEETRMRRVLCAPSFRMTLPESSVAWREAKTDETRRLFRLSTKPPGNWFDSLLGSKTRPSTAATLAGS